ncbi:MAG: hypothetical protein NXI24_02895 [bacterium]|nr:hypothetical protein [bacterium]
MKRTPFYKLSPALLLLTAAISTAGCSSSTGVTLNGDRRGPVTRFYQDLWQDPVTGPRLHLARMDKSGRLVILANDLDIPAQIAEAEPLAYSANASGAVWVGTRFPYEKAIKLIGWSRNYYTGLRYVALSDYVNRSTSRFDQDLFIGGSTEKAVMKLNLRAWQDSDWRALSRAASQEDFHSIIRATYPAAPGQ